ncbi:TolB-like translocation protein [Stenotrophomonas rhizophila]|uniref:WD40 repeat protein n=1 Tax=Stenotrophomonas rhizophila TaxID=216778 RepID=A0A7V7YF33_9GAMM|nr:PD40 domain-containing protein [Stenotrophomonas rhizophila]KAB7629786.1 hypothetical protein F9K92_12420 [Stenotrophomonas rhizophila]
MKRRNRRVPFSSPLIPWVILMVAISVSAAPANRQPSPSLLSLGDDGRQGNAFSVRPEISADGQVVAFISMASNLVTDARPGLNIYVRDVGLETTRLAYRDAGAIGAVDTDPTISGNGKVVALASTVGIGFHTSARQIVLVEGDERDVVSRNDDGDVSTGQSVTPSLSFNGRRVAFVAVAENLAPGCSERFSAIYLRDRATGTTRCLSVGKDGQPADGASLQPVISADGMFVAFRSAATNLVAGDTNGVDDVFVYSVGEATLRRVSVGADGAQAEGESSDPSISGDGTNIAFLSRAGNLDRRAMNGEYAVFVRDLSNSTTRLASVSSKGKAAETFSGQPRISADGRYVAFLSPSSVLAGKRSNGKRQIYRHDLSTGDTILVSRGHDALPGNGNSFQPAISANGQMMAFRSAASNLVKEDTNLTDDVFHITLPVSDR